MTKNKLIEELGNLAIRFSKGWHEGIKIDASDIMLFNQIAEALAQPEQEPVAWVSTTELLVMRGNALGGAKEWRISLGLVKQDGDVGLYTNPPQRKPLTEDEVVKMDEWLFDQPFWRVLMLVRAIEAAHGIKGKA